MSRSIPERDWKQLRNLKPELLNTLCERIHKQAESIIKSTDKSEHEKYLDLYKHIQDSDDIVARCFNDWRRSNISMKISQLLSEDLLPNDHIQNLSDETKEVIESWRSFQK
jgi:iron-sulfur cluster repair protein YtfE (RIC family)